ncbi:MAG: DUF971 domain-containing protein [Acidimicrobiia bacterium]|nr:DUF971 domain-containing protein [Acidimicrobiia bacterium]MBT8216844.1 DUF971 domain-containing protein [Acidimicrobiia bacterium]NNF11188.1 DUF971 domain-containing protein [Acidimicrobiia bacterium]NNL69913.1 DUF971 domain-containing protein [Acidimicrobiia bacterium]
MDVPDRIEISDGVSLRLTWPDGAVTSVSAAALRAACQCATCQGPDRTGAVVADPAAVRIIDARIVGAYAVNFTFAPDQHHTGIYPFERLRRLGEAA